jgi:hypothetical protein
MTSEVTNSFCCFECLQHSPSFTSSCFLSIQNPICYQYSCRSVRRFAWITAELSVPGTAIVVLRTLFVVSVLSWTELRVGQNESEFYIVLSLLVDNKLATFNQQTAQCCSLDICIIIWHWIFLHVSIHKESSSGNKTKAVLHKTKLAAFIHSLHGEKDSDIKPFIAGIKSLRATLLDEFFYCVFCFLNRAFR